MGVLEKQDLVIRHRTAFDDGQVSGAPVVWMRVWRDIFPGANLNFLAANI